MKRKDEITDLLAEGLCVEGVKYLNSNGEVIPSKTMRSGSSAPLLVIANSLANNEKTKSIAESPKWKEIIDPFLQEENAKKSNCLGGFNPDEPTFNKQNDEMNFEDGGSNFQSAFSVK